MEGENRWTAVSVREKTRRLLQLMRAKYGFKTYDSLIYELARFYYEAHVKEGEGG